MLGYALHVIATAADVARARTGAAGSYQEVRPTPLLPRRHHAVGAAAAAACARRGDSARRGGRRQIVRALLGWQVKFTGLTPKIACKLTQQFD